VGVRYWTIGVIFSVGVLAGCTGATKDAPASSMVISAMTTTPQGTEPATSDAATTSVSRMPTNGSGTTNGETAPVLPALAHKHNERAASTFAGYYFQALNWAIAINDAGPIRAIGTRTCEACSRNIHFLDSLRKSGDRLVGGRIDILSISASQENITIRADRVFDVRLHQTAEQRRSSTDRIVSRSQPRTVTSVVALVWGDHGWRIREIGAHP
jgi:Family of unknown function (DUF6318)